ncbi:MAG: hypothetical protein QXE78_09165 [Nitrososphaeria archaeon]
MNSEFSEVGEKVSLLNSIFIDIGQVNDSILDYDVVNGGLKKILAEAAALAEQRVREKFLVP